MKKQYINYNFLYLLGAFYFSITEAAIKIQPGVVPSLQILNTKSLFDFKDNEQKKVFSQQLKQGKILIESLKFNGLIIEGLDLSNMYLRGIKFNGCTFNHVNFKNSDLRETEFRKCHFQDVDLTNAIIYYPKKTASEKEVDSHGFKVSNWGHYQLVRLYSDLMKQSKAVKGKRSNIFFEKAKCLNKFIPALKLNLYDKNLKRFDLREIDLENANLEGASLQGARLSENVVVPNFSEDNRTVLFKLWINGNNEQQKAYQKLVNARFNITIGVNQNILCKGIQSKKDLRNASFRHARLKKADLTNANLKGSCLSEANLQEADLTNANLQKTNLNSTQLQRTKLSKNVVIPNYLENNRTGLFKLWINGNKEQQKAYQKLVNARFNITMGVDSKAVRKGIQSKKDFRNANLQMTQLQGIDLENANLEGANLSYTNLQGTNLAKGNLKNAYLRHCQLQGVNLIGANLQNTHLVYAHLQNAKLSKNIIVPNYPENDRTLLFNLWMNGNKEEQKIYQNLFNIGFDMTQGVKQITLYKGFLLKKDLSNAYLYELDLRDAILKGVTLENANLIGANLQKADLMNANLKNARLIDAQLQEAMLIGTNFESAYLNDVQLKAANLTSANLKGAHMINANLQRANLTGANLQGAILLDSQFQGADLTKANLAGAMLSRNYSLPLDCQDKDLMKLYKTCKNKKAKNMLKDILQAKNILIK